MAQIIPPLTTLPIDSSAAPSVEDIQDRLPSICVDYLSHDWSEEDVWASWRSMTRHKHEIANGVRLENASWRTWQKQRNKLKTISPETLNWLKDSDVTWLYGPLHTAHVEPVRPLKVATADERLGLDIANPASRVINGPERKPILKHRTLSEMLSMPMPASPILESSRLDDDDDDIDSLDGTPERPTPQRTKSDSNIFRNRNRRRSPPRPHNSASATPGHVNQTFDFPPPSGKRHISFNTFVEQCVAIDEQEAPIYEEEDTDMLEMKMSSSASSSSRSSRQPVAFMSQEPHTIAKIAPTLLKVNGTYAATAQPQMVYAPPPEYVSPPISYPGRDFDFPTPPAEQYPTNGPAHPAQPWNTEDDDGYGAGSFDYFGGPDFSAENPYPTPVNSAYYRVNPQPTVTGPIGPVPAAPKWRQQLAGTPGSSELSSSTSSTSSLVNAAGSQQQQQQQPTRGILKVRAPNSAPPPPPGETSPSISEFNYNPSVATGIGGMRGVGGYDYPMGGHATPPINSTAPMVSPTGDEPRGRSSTRDRSSAAFDRSLSRGTSVSSSSSLSPGSSGATRTSPIEPNRRTAAGNAARHPSTIAQSTQSVQGAVPIPPSNVRPNSGGLLPSGDRDDRMDLDEPWRPEQSDTPTPHSSPQISLRILKDTSPASLPHNSGPSPPPFLPSAASPADLPKADPPTRVGTKATTAHVGTNAQPTLSQPLSQPMSNNSSTGAEYMDDDMQSESDAGSMLGRAANIANTAKDLIGTLWYGNGPVEGEGRAMGLYRTLSGDGRRTPSGSVNWGSSSTNPQASSAMGSRSASAGAGPGSTSPTSMDGLHFGPNGTPRFGQDQSPQKTPRGKVGASGDPTPTKRYSR